MKILLGLFATLGIRYNKSRLHMSTTVDRVYKIQEVLDHYYPNPPVPLNNKNDFTLLAAVVLSAQTTDGKVNDATAELFKRASTPQEMAKLDPASVETMIRSVGLAPKKSQYLVNLSKMLVEKFQGVIPSSFAELESLPGVGHKTASVIRSQIFGIPAFAVDTHVHRLALRWHLSGEKTNVDKVQRDICELFPEDKWNKLHLQMIYFGREFCTAKDHENSSCPICSWVNKTSNIRDHIVDYSKFASKPKASGIVYYQDRIDQLKKTPSLAFHHEHNNSRNNSITSNSNKIEMKNEIDEDIDAKPKPKKRKTK